MTKKIGDRKVSYFSPVFSEIIPFCKNWSNIQRILYSEKEENGFKRLNVINFASAVNSMMFGIYTVLSIIRP